MTADVPLAPLAASLARLHGVRKAYRNITALDGVGFTIRHGEEALSARSVTLLCDGLEVIVTVNYPRPARGELAVRAGYYDTVEEMRHGSFVAHDENAKQLGGAVLSRANTRVMVTLPAKETNPAAAADPATN